MKSMKMKILFFITFTILTLGAHGQDKHSYVHFNKLTEVSGTEYVIASIENLGKTIENNSEYLLFINTTNGDTNKIDFPGDARIRQIEQVRIDSLVINLIILTVRTIDLDGKSGIDWNDPTQVIILSPDGKIKTQLTQNNYFVRTWTVNRLTGTIVITGHHDSNNNNKYDKTDKNEIQVYDLKTFKLISKI